MPLLYEKERREMKASHGHLPVARSFEVRLRWMRTRMMLLFPVRR
ncbi:MAG: hypothetical protein ACLR8Y_07575 [Alistipes indistinctus]